MKNNTLFRLFSLMGRYKWFEFLGIVFAVVGAVISLYAYTIIYDVAVLIFTSVGSSAPIDQGVLTSLGYNAVFYTCSGFGVYGMGLLFSHLAAFNTVAVLRVKTIKHLGMLSLGYHSMNASGKLRKIIEKNTDNLENTIAHQIPDFASSMVLPIAFLVFMFSFDWRLSLACLTPILIGFIMLALMLKDSSKSFVEKQEKSAEDISNAATEYVRGISVVKAFGQTVNSFKRFSNAVKEYKQWMAEYAMSMKKADCAYNTIINAVFFFLIPLVIIIYNGAKSHGDLVFSFIFFCVIIPVTVTILTNIMGSTNKLMLCEASINALEAILEKKPLPTSNHPQTPQSFDIEFNNVNFSYVKDAPKALDDFTLNIPQGKVTALVGQSGGGKSTVANLIARFYDADEGTVSIGGIDVRDIDYKWLTQNISIVFQNTNLFKISIADNVSFTNASASREDILRALRLAQCDDILEKLPKGADTIIGTKGVYLSGGEMQRIALARAILKDAPIILLDEATAFADSENEHLIQKAFSELLKDKTVLMIAHRLSTVSGAAQICLIENGKITESGVHEELLEKGGMYSQMYGEYQRSISWKVGGEQSAKQTVFDSKSKRKIKKSRN